MIGAFAALGSGPLFAAPSHEICDAMDHACPPIDAIEGCCCGDASDVNPSRGPVARADLAPSAHAVLATVAPDLPAVTPAPLHEAPLTLTAPPDLRILFSDLRI